MISRNFWLVFLAISDIFYMLRLLSSVPIWKLMLTVTLIYGWELGEMLASLGTALAAEFFGTMTAAIYPDASRSTLRS